MVIAASSPVRVMAQQVPDYPTGGTIRQQSTNDSPVRDDLDEAQPEVTPSQVATRFRSGVYLYRWFSPLFQRNTVRGERSVAVRTLNRRVSK